MSYTLYVPENYNPVLSLEQTEKAIKLLKDNFELNLSAELCLRRITAPLFVMKGTGINDDLNGIERPVSFPIKAMGDREAEVVHSLAKWKRMVLADYQVKTGFGIYTDMNAIRPDEEMDNIHSLYVDQWDWELAITKEDRNLDFLKETVNKIYSCLRRTEYCLFENYSALEPMLPEKIHFIHSEELLALYPDKTPKQREQIIAQKYGAVFIIGIGGKLSNGEAHDGRAPDYDDWTSETINGFRGLNGDIILWNPILNNSFEISSMGIRVDKEALIRQLTLAKCEDRMELLFHKRLINGELPLSIGGGIGQSRLCMFFLRKAHIGEIQSSIWPAEMFEECMQHNIRLI